MATIKDVAKLAGVGISTASRVINKSGYVSESTKIKVQDAINKLGYVPNETARAFVTQDSKIVALFLPSIHHAFFSELAYYIEDALDKNGYKMLLCNSTGNIQKELSYISMLKQNKVSGIIGISYNEIESEIHNSMPIVLVDRHIGTIPYVSSDNYGGGKIAFQVLKDTGCQHLAYIGSYSNSVLTEVEKRQKGFEDAAKEDGMDYIIYTEEDPIKDQTAFLKRFLSQYKNVDGVFAENDLMALELFELAKEQNIKVPEELSIIGYDGIKVYEVLKSKLSSIRQPVEVMGRSLVELLIKRIKGSYVTPVIHPVEFVKGETTR
ncbi:LacI family DNA-binding transcriptional regulator [Gracilibacillus salitolerans]|uniref:LacI family DNA-binding transcriptional regulator n=1 Tax=Gracilibacillus salitolerans TaxID=2663022 RepID=A0A5Q2TM33_9BACI|nr:LacI family DNA-binding transcriptional regulator [Gracilibacillus salitolerans]QGH36039.1 LacI family DNA-binding transcriptional regulator [Gracilibacillus salitolerans]